MTQIHLMLSASIICHASGLDGYHDSISQRCGTTSSGAYLRGWCSSSWPGVIGAVNRLMWSMCVRLSVPTGCHDLPHVGVAHGWCMKSITSKPPIIRAPKNHGLEVSSKPSMTPQSASQPGSYRSPGPFVMFWRNSSAAQRATLIFCLMPTMKPSIIRGINRLPVKNSVLPILGSSSHTQD